MNNFETSFAHGLSRAKACVLELGGFYAVKNYFEELKKMYPNRKLNKTEKELQMKYNCI